jgi:hypothetical protein
MTKFARADISDLIMRGVLAGAAGGLAEIVWVSLYSSMTGADASLLARGVTTAAGVTALLPSAPISTGIAVHMGLAVLLGVALAGLWQMLATTLRTSTLYAVMLVALSGVWAINFFVILPAISPGFVHLVPYAVSFSSKLLFAIAAAETLRHSEVFGSRIAPARIRAR